MQTDSHMDVVKDWDHKLMEMWGRVNNEYGILTTYVHKIEQLQGGMETKKEVPHLCQVKRNASTRKWGRFRAHERCFSEPEVETSLCVDFYTRLTTWDNNAW